MSGAGARLDDLRSEASRRRVVTVGAVLVGLVFTSVHWAGFLLGGALVALPQQSVRRGLLAALAFGVLGWLSFLTFLGNAGALTTYLVMGQVLAVSTVAPLVLALLGGLVRGLR